MKSKVNFANNKFLGRSSERNKESNQCTEDSNLRTVLKDGAKNQIMKRMENKMILWLSFSFIFSSLEMTELLLLIKL